MKREEVEKFKVIPCLVHAAGPTVPQKVISGADSMRTDGRVQLQTPGTEVSEEDPGKHAGLRFEGLRPSLIHWS